MSILLYTLLTYYLYDDNILEGPHIKKREVVVLRVGYIRISTGQQNPARQETALADCEKVFTDVCSGKNRDRPQLQAMLAFVRSGDVVVVESFSRLARSTVDLLGIVEFLQKKGVSLESLKEQIDTGSPQGRLVLKIFAALAEFEREQILERQQEGIREAKRHDAERVAAGLPAEKYTGGKRIQTDPRQFTIQYKAWKSGKITATEAMQALGLKPNTFYRRVRDYEQDKRKENK